jgi:helix-turn-helix protein
MFHEKNNGGEPPPPEERKPRPGGERGLHGSTTGLADDTISGARRPQRALPKPAPKKVRVLAFLATGARLDRFEAARELKDWVLPSTICELEKMGLRIERELVTLPALGGAATVTCAKYWLADESRELARQVLERRGRA